jgi:hypothetical protein
VGNAFQFELFDHLNDKRGRIWQRVTAADDRRVEINGSEVVFDQMGGVLKNRFGEKDPALLIVPAELFTGRRWRSASWNTPRRGSREKVFVEIRVAGLEHVETPAGRFHADRIEFEGEAIGPNHATRIQGKT